MSRQTTGSDSRDAGTIASESEVEYAAVGAVTPPVAHSRHGKLHRMKIFLLITLVALAVGGGHWAWRRATAPRPPEVDLIGADPIVADVVRGARAAVEQSPYSADAWGQLAMILHANHFHQEARVCYRQAEALDPHDPRWPYLQTQYIGTTDPEELIPALKRAVQLTDEPAPRLALGEMLLEAAEIDRARKHFEFVLEKDPDNARALLGMGRVAQLSGEFKQSLDYLSRSAKLEPKNRKTFAVLAVVQGRMRMARAAERSRELATKLSNRSPWEDPFLAALVRFRTGQSVMLKDGDAAMRAGELDKALKCYQTAARLYPDSSKAQYGLGLCRFRRKEFEEAEARFRSALKIDRKMPEANFFLAALLSQKGKYRESVEHIKATTREKPQDAAAFFLLGQNLIRLNKHASALSAFKNSVNLRPNHLPAQRILAKLYLRFDKLNIALFHVREAQKLDPNDRESRELGIAIEKKLAVTNSAGGTLPNVNDR